MSEKVPPRISLSFKLIVPIFAVGLLVLAGMALVMYRYTVDLVFQTVESDARHILESIIIASEVDSSQANLRRLTNAIAVHEAIDTLYMIDKESLVVVAANKNSRVNRKFAEAAEPAELQAYQEYLNLNSSPSALFVRVDEPFLYFIQQAELLTENKDGVRKAYVFLAYDESYALYEGQKAVFNTTLIYTVGLVLLLLSVFIVQRQTVLLPLSHIIRVMKKQQTSKELVLSKITSNDELGTVSQIYNELAEERHESQIKIQSALEQAESSNRMKTAFLANMSHELRTPMNSIIGFSNRILAKRDTMTPERMNESVEAIHRNAHHLMALINDLLDLSKIDAGKLELRIVKVDAVALWIEVANQLEPLATSKGLKIIRTMNAFETVELQADAVRVKQMMLNLLSNAIKYTETGSITVSCKEVASAGKQWIVLEVEDTGIGIRQDDQERMFKRFEQFDDQSRFQVGSGTGLGLSIIAEFARLHGGFVQVESEFGKGSVFRTWLPKAGPAF